MGDAQTHLAPPDCAHFVCVMDMKKHGYNTFLNVDNSWTQMCMGFTKHIFIGLLSRHEKRNAAVVLYCLHFYLTSGW